MIHEYQKVSSTLLTFKPFKFRRYNQMSLKDLSEIMMYSSRYPIVQEGWGEYSLASCQQDRNYYGTVIGIVFELPTPNGQQGQG